MGKDQDRMARDGGALTFAPEDEAAELQEGTTHAGGDGERGSGCDGITRRSFVQGSGVVAGGLALGVPVAALGQERAAGPVHKHPLMITINGKKRQLEIDSRVSLLDLLREELALTGTKKGCDRGQCGACTVVANGRRVNSCLSLALVYQGGEITTVEGLAHGDELSPVQAAFLEHDGYQCGYCTPGQIISAVALIDEVKKGHPSVVTADLKKGGPVDLSDDEIRERMSGNICRCGAYPGIVAAVRQAFGQS